KPPILFLGLFRRKARISPCCRTRKAVSPGHQKLTSVRPTCEARKSNQALSVLATYKLIMEVPLANLVAKGRHPPEELKSQHNQRDGGGNATEAAIHGKS